jgi:hypothetical protein
MLDHAYSSKYLGVARMLWNAAEGDPSRIPSHYANHLSHAYGDGDISLVPTLNRFEGSDELEDWELEEAVELLGKANPQDWPFSDDIVSVDPVALLKIYDEDATPAIVDFAEVTTEEKVEQVLTHVIESVFGDKVQKVRSKGGKYFHRDNQYGKGPDGTFSGQFEFDGKKFDFNIIPDEQGWTCQYRMQAASHDALPPIPREEADKHDGERRVRNRGWN